MGPGVGDCWRLRVPRSREGVLVRQVGPGLWEVGMGEGIICDS